MPIEHSDQIKGTIYIIATNAAHAQRRGLEHIGSMATDEPDNFGIHDDYGSARADLYNQYNKRDPERERIYKFSIGIQVANGALTPIESVEEFGGRFSDRALDAEDTLREILKYAESHCTAEGDNFASASWLIQLIEKQYGEPPKIPGRKQNG